MVQVAAGRRAAAFLAAAVLISCHAAAPAQEAGDLDSVDAPLDPSAPLDPLPDLGVDWPDMDAPEAAIEQAPAAATTDASSVRSYAVRIDGLDAEEEPALLARFRELSTLEGDKEASANAAQIDRRAREDADLLAELLRSAGHYDATVEPRIEPAQADGVTVVLVAEPGPLYRFAEVRLPGLERAGAAEAQALEEAFGIRRDDPVDATRITAGEAALRSALGERGYAFAEVGATDIVVDHESRTATLVLPVDPNGSRKFGRIVAEGVDPLFTARHIQGIARFRPGDPYEASEVEDLRRALVRTGLVSTIAIRPIDNPETKAVDLAVALEPAPMRTIAGALGYGTGEGLRLEASWQHRNLLPPEGAVTFRGVAGTREQLLGATLRRSNFGWRDRVLTANVVASHVDREAYEATTFLMGIGLERQTNIYWQKEWTWSVGLDVIATDERDVDIDSGTERSRTYLIGAAPLSLSYDGSNDLLDPTTGFRLSGRLSPELSLQGSAFGYARAQVDGSFYQPVSDTVTVAGRARFGTIVGASRDRIAPSRRFYAGGGASVRGFGYQELGPRDPVFDDPIGGRSLAEFALEARVRVGDFGIVPFIDAGNIATSTLPRFDELRFGAGIGVRYHTSFGPIRVDVGTPLGRREGESLVAVYVSLGQAF